MFFLQMKLIAIMAFGVRFTIKLFAESFLDLYVLPEISCYISYHPCMVYLSTFTIKNQGNVGKYTNNMDGMGIVFDDS